MSSDGSASEHMKLEVFVNKSQDRNKATILQIRIAAQDDTGVRYREAMWFAVDPEHPETYYELDLGSERYRT